MSYTNINHSHPQNRFSSEIGGDKISDKNEYIKRHKKIIEDKERMIFNRNTTDSRGSFASQKELLYRSLTDKGQNEFVNNPVFSPNPIIESHNRDKYANNEKYINDKNNFDPYIDFVNREGLVGDNIRIRYNIVHIDINSFFREKSPSYTTREEFILKNNPLSITENLLWIDIENHNMIINDQISLFELPMKEVILSSLVSNVYAIEFKEDSEYARVRTSPNISVSGLGNLALSYDTSNMFVFISGIKGFPNIGSVGNIPLNYLNTKHRVHLFIPNSIIVDEQPSDNYFFIKLPEPFKGNQGTESFNIRIRFEYYGGIPTNEINAQFPVTPERKNGNHLVKSIQPNRIAIELKRKGYFSGKFGGNNMGLYLLDNVEPGYPNPNSYKVSLESTFNNVVQVKMLSSEFPNTTKAIKDFPEDITNNKLYFQNVEDGEQIYEIEIEAGNYTTDMLKTILERKFYEVQKVLDLDNTRYTNNNYITIDINKSTNLVRFRSYKEANLIRPITGVSPTLTETGNEEPAEEYTITIEHTNHKITQGTEIIITGAINHLGIPDCILNDRHIVSEIVNEDRYNIILRNFNLEKLKESTNGGYNVTILVPNLFRMRFDFPDTMGEVLGFHDVGKTTSKTEFKTEITNKDLYDGELSIDEFGRAKRIAPSQLLLSGENTIFISCKELSVIQDTNRNNNIFAKINLPNPPGTMNYNTFVNTPLFFYDPITSLSELTFDFYDFKGNPFDFDYVDHSFTIEITTLDNTPEYTGISPARNLSR